MPSKSCTNARCFPVYSLEDSETSVYVRDLEVEIFKNYFENDIKYRCGLVTDRVCLSLDRFCAKDVGFLTMGDDWPFYNFLGLAPKSLSDGPVVIKSLYRDGAIDSQRATI